MSSIFPETTGRALEELETMFTDHEGRKYLGTPLWRWSIVIKRASDQELLYQKVKNEAAYRRKFLSLRYVFNSPIQQCLQRANKKMQHVIKLQIDEYTSLHNIKITLNNLHLS